MVNFNNPSKIPEISQSIVAVPSIFGTSNPELLNKLPQTLNLGITSPGFIDKATSCNGLDFVNTNPSYNKVTFQQCLENFAPQYAIPAITFNNLLNNLPPTYAALKPQEQKNFINQLESFINKVKNNDPKEKNDTTETNDKNDTKESFEISNNIEYYNSSEESGCESGVPSLTFILLIITVLILFGLFLLFITKNN